MKARPKSGLQLFVIQRSSSDFVQVVETMMARLPERGDSLVQRLAHICSVRDYFTTFEYDDQESYEPSESELLMARSWNEGRLQLALEAGIQPLYVDDPGVPATNGYVKRAKACGFAVHFADIQ